MSLFVCTLLIAPRRPPSTLLLFTVSLSVAKTYHRDNLSPPSLCLRHSAHLVACPQHVEGQAARCCGASQSSSPNSSSESLEAGPERVTELKEQ